MLKHFKSTRFLIPFLLVVLAAVLAGAVFADNFFKDDKPEPEAEAVLQIAEDAPEIPAAEAEDVVQEEIVIEDYKIPDVRFNDFVSIEDYAAVKSAAAEKDKPVLETIQLFEWPLSLEVPLPDYETGANAGGITYTDFRFYTCPRTLQHRMQLSAYTDPETGIRMYEGFYMVAMASYYSEQCGDVFRITFSSGKSIEVITADIKQDQHSDKEFHQVGISGDILEFIVDSAKVHPDILKLGNVSSLIEGAGSVMKIEHIGEIMPQYRSCIYEYTEEDEIRAGLPVKQKEPESEETAETEETTDAEETAAVSAITLVVDEEIITVILDAEKAEAIGLLILPEFADDLAEAAEEAESESFFESPEGNRIDFSWNDEDSLITCCDGKNNWTAKCTLRELLELIK